MCLLNQIGADSFSAVLLVEESHHTHTLRSDGRGAREDVWEVSTLYCLGKALGPGAGEQQGQQAEGELPGTYFVLALFMKSEAPCT